MTKHLDAFQIVALLCSVWSVCPPPAAGCPVGVSSNPRQYEMDPKHFEHFN